MTAIQIDHITKKFGATIALNDVSLEIHAGELFFLLGPSGCGKSTLLRTIAGLQEPTSGRILFNGDDVTPLSTDKRNAVMCFQSYALWPHMTVRDNVRFGLDVRKTPAEQLGLQVDRVLDMVQMRQYADRKPNQLSGGQQQRVALARALAVNPACLLLDEPLSNLDSKLRHDMRSEIRRICKEGGFTTIYVTHSQKEALSVADRIAVLKDGKLVQVGTPGELYHRPNCAFVADFIGHTNLLRGTVSGGSGETVQIDTAVGRINALANGRTASLPREPESVIVSIRPEHMRIVSNGASPGSGLLNRFSGKPLESSFLGEASEHVLQVGSERLKVVSVPPLFEVPGELWVEFHPEDVLVLTQ